MAEAGTARPRFQQLQYAFAAHLRDPERVPGPAGVEDRRLKIYRELFFNNIENFLANAFPVLRQLHEDAAWLALVRDFYARHQSKDPLFTRLAEEFLRYLEDERDPAGDPPFLRELAHYEWVELALSLADDELSPALGGADTVSCDSEGAREAPLRPAAAPASLRSGIVTLADPNGDLLAQPPCVSPLAWTLAYQWPVHRIGPDYRPAAPPEQPSYLVVYRTRQDAVKFLEINAVTARLLALAEEKPQSTGRELIAAIAAELGAEPESLMAAGAEMLRGLREREVIVGTRRAA